MPQQTPRPSTPITLQKDMLCAGCKETMECGKPAIWLRPGLPQPPGVYHEKCAEKVLRKVGGPSQ